MARAAAAAAALALLVAAVAAARLPLLRLPARVAQGAINVPGFDTGLLTNTPGELVFELLEPQSNSPRCPTTVELALPGRLNGDDVVFPATAVNGDCTADDDVTFESGETEGGPAFEMVSAAELGCESPNGRSISLILEVIGYADNSSRLGMLLTRANGTIRCSYEDDDGAASAGATDEATTTQAPSEVSTATQTPDSITTADTLPATGATDGGQDEPTDTESTDTESSDPDSEAADSSDKDGGGLAAGAKIGIGAGVGALALLALLFCCCCCLMRRRKSAGVKASGRNSFSSGEDVKRIVPTPPPSLSPGGRALPALEASPGLGEAADVGASAGAGAAAGVGAAAVVGAATGSVPALEETSVRETVRLPVRVWYDSSVDPVSDKNALRDGGVAAGVGIGEDGALPLHVAIALDTSELACSADHDDGDVRSLYARALGEMLDGMGDDVSMSLVSFSGDEAKVVETGGRIRADVDAATEALATVVPPAGARTSRATPKAAMRAVNACIGLLRETPADKRVAKRVLMVSGGGVEDGEMRELRAQANGGRGWKTANCVVTVAVGPLAKIPPATQLGAVAVDVDEVDELAKPEVIGLVKALFAADDPRSVR